MEEDDWFGFGIWGVFEVVEVAIWAETADHLGSWRGINGLAEVFNGDLAVITKLD